jgi:signal transduction histidine kinase
MIKRVMLVILLFSALPGYGQKQPRWEKYYCGKGVALRFVAGNFRSFHLQDGRGTLYYVNGDQITISRPPENVPVGHPLYLRINKNDFFYISTGTDWRGNIYRVTNGKWRKYRVEIPNPLNYLVSSDGGFFALGDFGLFYRFKNDSWQKLKTPYSSHCFAAYEAADGGLIIVTKSDGVFRYKEGEFFYVEGTKSLGLISNSTADGNRYFFQRPDEKIFVWQDDKTSEVKDSRYKALFNTLPDKKFGFGRRAVFAAGKLIEITFPIYYKIVEVKAFSPDSLLLLGKNGYFYRSKKESGPGFIDMAAQYGLKGVPDMEGKGILAFDGNEDAITDILTIQNNFGNYLTLHRGTENSSFANITSISGLPFTEYPVDFVTSADIDKDGLNDLLLQCTVNGVRKIQLFNNEGNFHFRKSGEFPLPEELQLQGIRQFYAFDYDTDGDADIILTAYYGRRNEPGYLFIYKNNFWGDFSETDTTLKRVTRHWNEETVFADIDNDGDLDIYNAVSWHKDHILINRNGKYTDEGEKRLPSIPDTRISNTFLMDFDNDGDLDLFETGVNIFIKIFLNDGHGFFSVPETSLFAGNFARKNTLSSSVMRTADFNNDGYSDILATIAESGKVRSVIFFNEKGRFFHAYRLPGPAFLKSVITDIDNDGDPDIFGFSEGQNILLINTLDSGNFIGINLKGIVSGTSSLASKAFIYAETGEKKKKLFGYKQLSSYIFNKSDLGRNRFLFGVNSSSPRDVLIRFPSGKELFFKDVRSGSYLEARELNRAEAFIYEFPGAVYRFFSRTENLLFLFIVFFVHSVLFSSLVFAYRRLMWPVLITSFFAVGDISLFWAMFFFFLNNASGIPRFIAAPFITLLFTEGPILASWLYNRSRKRDIAGYNDRLLSLIFSFSHGEWALRNLNSILLLCENAPDNWRTNREFLEKLRGRLSTFRDMTKNSLLEIISLEKLILGKKESLTLLENTVNEVSAFCEHPEEKEGLEKLISHFKIIRNNIKTLRNGVFLRFSSDPAEVIRKIAANFEDKLRAAGITLEKTKAYEGNIPVLIKNYELGDILDNLFQNAVRYTSRAEKKLIRIELLKESPKIIIRFINTGLPVPEEKREKIFEPGYSESGSTGLGLYTTREILKKYGARIFVEKSGGEETVFRIELNEGAGKN